LSVRHRPALSTKQGGHLLNANAYSFAKFRLSTGLNVWGGDGGEKWFFVKNCYRVVFKDYFLIFFYLPKIEVSLYRLFFIFIYISL